MEDGKKMNNLNVIYEDNHIIVVEKPYNVPVQEDSSSDIDMITIIKRIAIFINIIPMHVNIACSWNRTQSFFVRAIS